MKRTARQKSYNGNCDSCSSNSNTRKSSDRPVKQLDFYAEFGHNISVHSNSNSVVSNHNNFGSYPYQAELEKLWTMHAAAYMRNEKQLEKYADSIMSYIIGELRKSSDKNAAEK